MIQQWNLSLFGASFAFINSRLLELINISVRLYVSKPLLGYASLLVSGKNFEPAAHSEMEMKRQEAHKDFKSNPAWATEWDPASETKTKQITIWNLKSITNTCTTPLEQ